MFEQFSKHKIIIVLILAVGILLRVMFINVVPPGLANDEANIVLNAKSILTTGKIIPGVVMGVIGTPTGNYTAGIHSELSSIILAIFYAVFGFQWNVIKLPFIVTSLGIAVILALITKELVNKKTAYIVLALAAINPWLVQFGRSGYESIFSAFFYLSAILIIVKFKNWKILYALPLLFAGFLSYFSAKTLLLPLSIMSVIVVKLIKPKASLKPIIYLNIAIIVFTLIYSLILKGSPAGARFNEFNNNNTADQVNSHRTHSISYPLEVLVENKFTEEVKYRLQATLNVFTPSFLFLNGKPENSGHLSLPYHGPLYPIDAIFLLIGVIYLARKKLKTLLSLCAFIVPTFVPNFINLQGTTFMIRTVILFPLLLIIIASGIYATYKAFRSPKVKRLTLFVLIFLYVGFLSHFVYQYYFRMPIHNADAFFLHDRVATHYIQSELEQHPDRNIIWVTPNNHFTFYRYIFFSNNYSNSEKVSRVNQSIEQEDYQLGKVKILNTCPEDYDTNSTLYLLDPRSNCETSDSVAIIANIDDAGAKYQLINDPLCQEFVHNRYPLIKYHRQLDIESLSRQEFCENFISNNQK